MRKQIASMSTSLCSPGADYWAPGRGRVNTNVPTLDSDNENIVPQRGGVVSNTKCNGILNIYMYEVILESIYHTSESEILVTVSETASHCDRCTTRTEVRIEV